MNTVIGTYGAVYDPCDFVPDINCGPSQSLMGGGGGSSLMSGSSSSSTSSGPDLAAVLEEWGFEDWEQVADWMSDASPSEVGAFLLDIAGAADG